MAQLPNGFTVEILESGLVKVTTETMNGAVHLTADRFAAWLDAQFADVQVKHKVGHVHAHEHEHNGVRHSH